MVPTFIIDWPAILSIGLIFGFGVKGVPSRSLVCTRAFGSGLLVLTLFVGLVSYSYLLAPDWMLMYFADGDAIPDWIIGGLLLLYYVTFFTGFFLKFELARFHRRLPFLTLAASLAACALIILPVRERYLRVGTLEEFLVGGGVPLSDSPVWQVPGTLSMILFPLTIFLLIWSRRQRFS